MATLRPLESQYGLTIGGSLVIDRERNLAVENASIKNLNVTGTITAVNSTETYIKDSNILLNSGIEAGNITTLGTITGGSNYTPGTYRNVLLTIVSGTAGIGATADITVNSSGAVSAVTIVNAGYGYATNTVFSAAAADLDSDTSPNGTGFQVTVTAVGAGSAATDAFITVGRGTTGTDVQLKWNESTDKWQITNDGSAFGNIVSTADTGTVTNTMLAGSIALNKLSSDTTTALGVGTIELGNASDTTLSRSAAGVLAVEGVAVPTISSADTLTNKTLTAPKITSASHIADSNGNELILFPSAVAAAVNELTISNAVTGSAPSISASGGDANINLNLRGKGTGNINIGSTGLSINGSTSGAVTLVTPATAGTNTVTLPATTGTVYVSTGTDVALTDGGTNASLTASAGSVVYSTASAMAFTTVGTAGQVLVSNGTSAPSFQTMSLSSIDTWTKGAVKAATTADLGTVTYANGTAGVGATITGPTGASAVVFPTQDGVTIGLNDRILVKNQTAGLQNGIYTLTTVGVAATTAWVLTRATDADTAAEMAGLNVVVAQGTTQGGYTYDSDFKATDTVGTTAVSYYRVLDTSAISTSALLAGLISDETGSGALVFANTPTLVTPVLGVATATSINKVAITAPATSATLTIADNKTLTVSNTLTFTGTDGSSVAFGAGGTVAYTGGNLSQFASTTSAQLAGVISDETGTGLLVFATSPTLTTPRIASASHIADSNGNELILFPAAVASAVNEITVSNAATGGAPSISATGGDANVNLSLSSKGTGRVTVGSTGLGIRDTSAAFDVTLVATSSTALAANRQLTIDVVNAGRTIKLAGNLDIANNFTTSGNFALTLTTTAATNVTLPTSGTLVANTINQTGASTNSGAVSITTGNASGATSNSGAITIDTGTATGTTGAITIGGTNASQIRLGKAQTNVFVGTDAAVATRTTSLSVATATVVDSFATATFRSCEYLVQITQGSSHQITKILLVHDGTTVFITEYGTVVTSGSTPIAPLDAVINGANVELQITTGNTNAHTVKVTRTAIIV